MAQSFSEWRRENSGTLADWKHYLSTQAAPVYRVIYQFGDTEVEGLRPYDTREEAEEEARAAGDEDFDLAWVEEVTS